MESLTKKIGKRFKNLLEVKKLTQEEAASILEVDERTIRRWIKDGIDRISTLEDISKKFGVDILSTFFNL